MHVPSLIRRFDQYRLVGEPDACWPWQGTIHRKGYGQISDRGRSLRAHRVAWEMAYGPIPAGLHVLHHCDNRPCCNPAHLFLGTAADNQVDKARKGRAARGEANGGGGKLTESDVAQIRRMLAAGDACKAIGQRFGVSGTMVGNIKRGRAWAHV